MAETLNQTSTLLTELIDAALDDRQSGLRVALPGRIESYDKATRRATVQLLVQDGHVDGNGERQTTTVPPLTDVPVMFTGSNTVRIQFPIRPGDQCLVVFSSSSIAKWKSIGDVVDPDDDRHHHEADAIVIPGLFGGGNVDDDDAMIEFTDAGLIRAGGDEPLVTRSEFLAHTHATAGTGTPSPPISGPPGSAVTFPGTGKLRG